MIIEQKDKTIVAFSRDENGVRKIERITDFEHYFYVGSEEDSIQDDRILKTEISTKKSLFGEKVKKVTVKNPYDLIHLRNMFYKTYEGDVKYTWRYWIDRVMDVPNEKLRKFYLDIETADMPDTQLNNQPITCIGWYDNYTDFHYTLIVDKDVINQTHTIETREKHIIYHCTTEYVLLTRLVELIHDLDPDMVIAHNGDRFDFPVIVGRLVALSVMGYGKMSPLGTVKRENPFGEWKTYISGRILFDFLGAKTGWGIKGGIRGLLDGRDITVKGPDGEDRIIRIKRWSLGYLAQFVGMKKGEYEKVESLEQMITYNKQDVDIMVELDKFFNVTEYYHNMQLLLKCPYEVTYFNTNMIDFFLMKRYNQFVFPTKPVRGKFDNDETIKGADVTVPKPGLYPIIDVVDQTSLYPTIVVSYNMSPEKLDPNGDIIVGNGIRFTSNGVGIIPDAVKFLLDIRLKYKTLAKSEPDAHTAQMYDLLSNGYKTLLVSFYGALLYQGFRLYNHDVAECIPYAGRIIKTQHVKPICEANGYEIIAGDSVTKDSIIPVKDINNNILFKKVKDLYVETSMSSGEKEYYLPLDLKTLSIDKSGMVSWNKVKKIMRHKTTKKVYDVVVSNKWHVNVTEDHSLIGYANCLQMQKMKLKENFIETKPGDIGKNLNSIVSMKYIPRDNVISKNYPKELYEFMGLFIGDGSFEFNRSGNCRCVSISAGKDCDEISEKVLVPLKSLGYISRFYIRQNGYDIRIYGNIVSIMSDFCLERNKIIPKWIEYETKENISSFIRGLFESDGSISKRSGTYIITFTNIREDFINKLQELLWYIGIPSGICIENNTNKYKDVNSGTYTLRLNIRNNFNYKENIGFITERKQVLVNDIKIGSRKSFIIDSDFDVVNHLKISEIYYDDYVYDLEVENIHTFFANGILVHNTDSSFLNPIDAKFNSEQLIDILNKSFDDFAKEHGIKNHIFHIELDKTYSPLLMSDVKKRYCGFLVKKGKKIYKATGFESVRRDTSPITEIMQETVFKMILNFKTKIEVNDFILSLKEKIKLGTISKEMIILPKGFNKAFDKFKVDSPYVRAAKYSNENLGTHFDQFSDLGIFYVKSVPKGKPYTDVVAVDSESMGILNSFEIDWKIMLDKTIDSKYENIKNMMGWEDKKQMKLGDF